MSNAKLSDQEFLALRKAIRAAELKLEAEVRAAQVQSDQLNATYARVDRNKAILEDLHYKLRDSV